jgi:hypothetical protein
MIQSFHRKETIMKKKSHLEEIYEPIKMQKKLLNRYNDNLVKMF